MANSIQDTDLDESNVPIGSPRPTILMFDSGVGGLSVYEEVRQLLPTAHYIYVFDNEGFPYGDKDESFIIERVVNITQQISQRYPIALAIVACNTASTISLPHLRDRFRFPVVGVVPAIKPAAQSTQNGVIGLLATKGTIARQYTQELITQFATKCQIEMIGAPTLVELAENKLYGQPVSLDEVAETVMPWLTMKNGPDTIILGCTHFPLLKDELRQVFPSSTNFVDSGAAIARRASWLLGQSAIYSSSSEKNIAFCTQVESKTALLLPVLQRYGFETLQKLSNSEQIE